MTVLRPHQVPPRQRFSGVRLSIVYGFRTLEHPGRGRVVLGYVGQTVQAIGRGNGSTATNSRGRT